MQQTPINYWYCPECECEVDSRNVTNNEKHDNCGSDVESRVHMQTPDTPQLSPIEKAIEDINSQIKHHKNYSNRDWIVSSLHQSVATLQSLLPYEKQHLRSVSEKAWDASEAHLGQMFLSSLKLNHPDKQTYQNLSLVGISELKIDSSVTGFDCIKLQFISWSKS